MLLILSLNRLSLLALSDLDGFSISMHGPYGSGGHVGIDTRGRTDVNACVGPSKGVERMGALPMVADVWGPHGASLGGTVHMWGWHVRRLRSRRALI
jgi:hypothetical protein